MTGVTLYDNVYILKATTYILPFVVRALIVILIYYHYYYCYYHFNHYY